MTVLLQKAFQKAAVLPDDMQDMLALEFLQEIEWQMQWDTTLENSQSALEKLTAKAMLEYQEGKTIEMGFDEL